MFAAEPAAPDRPVHRSEVLPPLYTLEIADLKVDLAEGESTEVELDGRSYRLKLSKGKDREVVTGGLRFRVPATLSGKVTMSRFKGVDARTHQFSGNGFSLVVLEFPLKGTGGFDPTEVDADQMFKRVAKQNSMELVKEEAVDKKAKSGVVLAGIVTNWKGRSFGNDATMTARRYEVRNDDHLVMFMLYQVWFPGSTAKDPLADIDKQLLETLDRVR